MTAAKRSHEILTIGFRGCVDLTAHELRLTGDELRLTGDELRLTGDELRLTGHEIGLTGHEIGLTAREVDLTGHEIGLTTHEIRLTAHELRPTSGDLRRKQRYRHRGMAEDCRRFGWPCASLDDQHSDQFSDRGALQNALGEHRIKVVGDSFCKRM